MSTIFGRRDFRQDLEDLIKKGDTKGACKYVLDLSTSNEKMSRYFEASNILKTFIDLVSEMKLKDVECLEEVYERLISAYVELNNINPIIDYSLKLANLKVQLGKINEAVQLLKVIDSKYRLSSNQLRKFVDIFVSIEHFPNALKYIRRILESEKDLELMKLASQISFNLGNYEEALDYLNTILVFDKENEYANSKVSELNKILEALKAPKKEEPKETKKVKEKVEPKKEAIQQIEQTPKPTTITTEPAKEQVEKKTEVISIKEEKPILVPKEETPITGPEIAKPTAEQEEKPTIPKPQAVELEKTNEEKPKIGQEVKLEHETKEETKKVFNLSEIPEYKEAISLIEKGNKQDAVLTLESLALNYEDKDTNLAVEIYEKILLIDNSNIAVAKKLAKILQKENRSDEAVFYLRCVADTQNKNARLEALISLSELLKDDANIKIRVFETYLDLGLLNEAYGYLKTIPEQFLNSALDEFLNYISNNKELLIKTSKFIKTKSIDDDIKFKYFYRAYRLCFEQGDEIEGIKWLIQAHLIKKLQLEDYFTAYEPLKNLKLPEENEIIAAQIYSYIEFENDVNKAFELSSKVIELDGNKSIYLAKHLELAIKTNNKKVALDMASRLRDVKAHQFGDLVYQTIKDEISTFTTEELVKFGSFFDDCKMNESANSIYLEILKKDPSNVIALSKTLISAVEKEDEILLLTFLDRFPPNQAYSEIIIPIIEKYKNLQLKDPFKYSHHFIIGFLYFFIGRYEEAIAFFQFVVRSHYHEPFMRLMLSICFEKTYLYDFAVKQLEFVVNKKVEAPIRQEILYRYALLKKNLGDVVSAKRALKTLLEISEYKDASILFQSLPNEEKIIDIRSDEK
ncbi:MAG: hypothetical protein K6343_01405 [Caldisericaceae bacterium]